MQAQSGCESVMRESGEICIVMVLNNFEGRTKEEVREDLLFAKRNDPCIRKLAITGDPGWKEFACVFTLKELRPVSIEYLRYREIRRCHTVAQC
jgi:hypothetical protein